MLPLSTKDNKSFPEVPTKRFSQRGRGSVSEPHTLEREVQRVLLAHPELHFSSLVVRRMETGICLQGVLETDESTEDVSSLAQKVAGVDQVLNHLLVTHPRKVPPKG